MNDRDELEELDAACVRLIDAASNAGSVCIVVRMQGGRLHTIFPKVGAPQIAEILQRAADGVFDGAH